MTPPVFPAGVPMAGRGLDARIAEEVMGWSNVGATQMFTLVADNQSAQFDGVALMGQRPASDERLYPECFEPVPAYSTDIAAAWLVVEAMEARGWKVTYRTTSPRRGLRRVEVDVPAPGFKGPSALYAANADTAPLAICLAALYARHGTPSTDGGAET